MWIKLNVPNVWLIVFVFGNVFRTLLFHSLHYFPKPRCGPFLWIINQTEVYKMCSGEYVAACGFPRSTHCDHCRQSLRPHPSRHAYHCEPFHHHILKWTHKTKSQIPQWIKSLNIEIEIAGCPSHPTGAAGAQPGSSGANVHGDDHPHHRDSPHPPCQAALPERSDGYQMKFNQLTLNWRVRCTSIKQNSCCWQFIPVVLLAFWTGTGYLLKARCWGMCWQRLRRGWQPFPNSSDCKR